MLSGLLLHQPYVDERGAGNLARRYAGKILPRHLQIIFEINDYFLKTLQEQYPNDTSLLGRASIIDESNGRRVRMAWLAVVVSHKVNGVSEPIPT